MSLVTISIDREKLPRHTNEEFEEWVRFQVGERGGMSVNNPIDTDIEAVVKGIS